ncbi:MAG: SAM-dependent chlorinase/fluorinase [Nitrospirae bacterium]|nr:SAM-dependent chlorinase/fluorinase [Nitrospirota bacterium]
MITLTTDFGYRDWFVGSMKGVIKSIAPAADIVDVTHEISPGDIRAASFVLAAAMPYFPKGTIHVAVVDPGVGSGRRAIAVRGQRYTLVGPDNGILTMPMQTDGPCTAVELTDRKFFLSDGSSTFHGRDVFAPVAAHLSRGVSLARMGKPMSRVHRVAVHRPVWRNGIWSGEIVYIDRFGNAITNLEGRKAGGKDVQARVGRMRADGLVPTYDAGKRGQPIALVNSLGLIEMALRGGNAAKRFRIRPGQAVTLIPKRAI